MKLPSSLRDVQFSITEFESVVNGDDDLSSLRSGVLSCRKVSLFRAGTKRRKNVTGMKGIKEKKNKS
jgi:hypothetical protein